MNVLVAVASRHGSTLEIAEHIASGLRAEGLSADAELMSEVDDPADYDAFVIGSATYMFHWLKEAMRFVERHRRLLESRPVWIFSSGPLGEDDVDADGKDVAEAAAPKEFEKIRDLLHPSDMRVFSGAWDPDAPAIGVAERMMRLLPAAKGALPAGDFRDWEAIEDWARQIATDLSSTAGSASE